MITTSEKNFITRAISLAFKYFVNITLNIRHIPYQKQASVYTVGEFHYYWNSTMYCAAGWESQTEWLQLSDQQPEQTTVGLIWFRWGHVVGFQTLKSHRVTEQQQWCCLKKDGHKDPAAFQEAQAKVAKICLQELHSGKQDIKRKVSQNTSWIWALSYHEHHGRNHIGEQWVMYTCSWLMSSLRPKWFFQILTVFTYQQVTRWMLKAVIILVLLLVKSVTTFVPKDYPHNETIIWLASGLCENCFKQLKL